jgi:hypothetical protein
MYVPQGRREVRLSTGDANNPDPVELPTLKQILVLPIVRRNLARRYRLDREHACSLSLASRLPTTVQQINR